MKKAKIFVCTYEDKVFIQDELFTPIQVGKANTGLDLGYLSDDTGENISAKNTYYSEMTALYWVWKNVKGLDYVGFCQYRKMPLMGKKTNASSINIALADYIEHNKNNPSIEEIIEDCDIVMANPVAYKNKSLKEMYGVCHIIEDLGFLEEVIKDKFPDYHDTYSFVMSHVPGIFHPYNVFFMKWEWFDKYCNWLFTILEELETKVDLKDHIGYQSRVFGYLAERLLNIFVSKNKLLIKTRPVAFIREYFTDERERKQRDAIKYGEKGIKRLRKETPPPTASQEVYYPHEAPVTCKNKGIKISNIPDTQPIKEKHIKSIPYVF